MNLRTVRATLSVMSYPSYGREIYEASTRSIRDVYVATRLNHASVTRLRTQNVEFGGEFSVELNVELECSDGRGFTSERKWTLLNIVTRALDSLPRTSVLKVGAVSTAGGQVVGEQYDGHDGRLYFCDSYDPDCGYWMTDVLNPVERRNVSERAIGRTFHRNIRLRRIS